MSVSFHTLAVTSQHPLGVCQVGGLIATTVCVASGSDVYYGEQHLNADENFGVLRAGESKTFTVPTWLLSRHSSRVEVEDYAPRHEVEQLKVGKDGRVKRPKRKVAIVGVTGSKPKRKKAKRPTKAREHTAERDEHVEIKRVHHGTHRDQEKK